MKKRILFPFLAVLFALGAAFATETMKDNVAPFASVEYQSGSGCDVHPTCKTTANAVMCTDTFVFSSNCGTSIPSWRSN